jgi:hypothetical protein
MDYDLLPLVRRLAHERGKNFPNLSANQFNLPCRMLVGHAQQSNRNPITIQTQSNYYYVNWSQTSYHRCAPDSIGLGMAGGLGKTKERRKLVSYDEFAAL